MRPLPPSAARALLLAVVLTAFPTGAGAGHEARNPDAPKPEIPICVEWSYRGVPRTMKLYELTAAGSDLPLWGMGTAASLDGVPAGLEIAGGVIRLRPGVKKRFLLVLRNDGKAPVRFFAAPHHVRPEAASLGFEFACLCLNHVYEAPAGGYWYRVVELTLQSDFGGSALTVRHTLIAKPDKKSAKI